MSHRFQINLENISHEGESFEFKAEEIQGNSNLNEVIEMDSSNFIHLEITPIDAFRYSLSGSIQAIQPLNCSRCGEDFKKSTKIKIQDFVSTQKETEGEDQGFVIASSALWDASDFLRELIVLETPLQIYKYGEKCLKNCPHYDEAVAKGWLTSGKEEKTNPFAELADFKKKLQ